MILLRPLLSLASATRRRSALALGLLAALPASAATDVWNSSGTAWGTASDWTSAAVPTATDTASFNPTGASANVTINNPDISGSQAALSIILANNPALGTYTFTGTGTLTLGGTGSTGLTTAGYGTTIFDGPAIAGSGASGTNLASFTLTTDSGLDLTGTSAATTNIGNISLYGGSLILDDSSSTTTRLPTTNTIVSNGGTVSVLGNSAGVTLNAGIWNVTGSATSPGEGLTTIKINQPSSATGSTVLNFANTGTTSLRTTTAEVYDFVATNGTFGAVGGPQVKFGTATIDVNSGLISNGSANTLGFAIVTDAAGTNFATYTTANGVAAVSATSATAASSLTSSTTNYIYTNASGSDSVSTIIGNSFNIQPATTGASLTLTSTAGTASTDAIQTQALMLNDSNNNDTFTINAPSGTYIGNATKYIYVINPTTILATNSVFFNGTNPVDIVGPGFVALTGSGSQVASTVASNKINLVGGTLRANSTQMNFTNSGGFGVFGFRGGVLEITGGSDGSGASADFTRAISASNAAGSLNWESTTAGDAQGGSGGFSAYGAAASVNIGGLATPSTLTWGVAGSGFVQNGQSLIFGSTKSNARLDFYNPIGLDAGTTGSYLAREVNVIGGAGGDSTRFDGVISGSSTTDLLKTGTGNLTLAAINTYAGNTLVAAGTLALSGVGTLGTGNLSLASATTFDISGSSSSTYNLSGAQILAGNGTINTGTNTLSIGGTLSPGFSTGALTINGTVTVSGFTNFEIGGNTTSLYTQIALTPNSTLNFGTSVINLSTSYTPTAGDTITLVAFDGNNTISGSPTFDGTSLPGSLYWNTSTFDTTGDIVAMPVPEPATYAAIFAAAALAVSSWRRRRARLA